MVLLFLCVLLQYSGAQETAEKYFATVSDRYKSLEDYTANLVITRGDSMQMAEVQYKNPNLLRLDFSRPAGMVIAVNNEKLQAWIPQLGVTFEQVLRRNDQAGASIASQRGLELLERYYTIAYAESPNPVPLDTGLSERVVKLQLTWKSQNEGFKMIELSINPAMKMIRRIRGITTREEVIVFDFSNFALDVGIPIARFDYQSPPIGNTISNLWFNPEE